MKSEMMSLEDFVKNSLVQIISGVANAQEEAKEKEAVVNPSWVDGAEKSEFGYIRGIPVQGIEFDVAVTVSEKKGDEAGLNLEIGVYKLFSATGGVKAESGSENIGIHRIKFKVPVLFPEQKK